MRESVTSMNIAISLIANTHTHTHNTHTHMCMPDEIFDCIGERILHYMWADWSGGKGNEKMVWCDNPQMYIF